MATTGRCAWGGDAAFLGRAPIHRIHAPRNERPRCCAGVDFGRLGISILSQGHIVRFGAALSGLFLITEALIGAGLVLLKLVVRDATTWSQSLHSLSTLALLACLALTAWWASGHRAPHLLTP